MDRARLVELFEVVLIALACPLALLFLKEVEHDG